MAYLDYKVTTWIRVQVDEENLDIIKEKLEQNCSISELYDNDLTNGNREILYETEEEISVKENQMNATKELYNDDGVLVWINYKD